jgi:alpha-galactosidase
MRSQQPPLRTPPDVVVHLEAAGVSLLVDLTRGGLPAIIHWGSSLNPLTEREARSLIGAAIEPIVPNVMDEPIRLAILPEHHTGWVGRPGVTGNREGRAWSPRFSTTAVTLGGDPLTTGFVSVGASELSVEAEDADAHLGLRIEIEMLASGLVRARATVTDQLGGFTVDDVALAFPVPIRAREVLDFAGRWGMERVPQRSEFQVGLHDRQGRKGRTGPDAATVLSAGVSGFGFAHGEVWGVHTAFSGNHRHYAERLFTGAKVIGGGELLLSGEIRLGRGESYTSPWVYAAYADGLDRQARRFHDYLRSRPTHPTRPRPVTINVWEAVYFDHDLARLSDLADRAAAIGVERYVLDDGWFRGRRDDHAGLGDWYVDEGVWPDGLGPLIDHVRGLGMEFGLWFEPEMINPDSDLAREHPEWIMATGGRLPVLSRYQQVLNLGIRAAYDRILERMTALLEEYDIAYIKWDHNRDLIDAGTLPAGEAGVHAQTRATYRLMAQLKQRFPGLEIESCSSGGARVDLGVMEHADRVWVSDCIDPLERQQMNRWTMQLLPPEMLGSHVASGISHTTGRWHRLSFRAGTALFGHFGIEWDLAKASETELKELSDAIELHKEHRELIRTGNLVRADVEDPTQWLYGTISPDRSEALLFLATTGRSAVSPRGRFTIPGLDPDRNYHVTPILLGAPTQGFRPPAWFNATAGSSMSGGEHESVYTGGMTPDAEIHGTVLSGRALAAVGLQSPANWPDEVLVLRLVAE